MDPPNELVAIIRIPHALLVKTDLRYIYTPRRTERLSEFFSNRVPFPAVFVLYIKVLRFMHRFDTERELSVICQS